MRAMHESQPDYMLQRDGLDPFDCMITTAKHRGWRCGARYAENSSETNSYLRLELFLRLFSTIFTHLDFPSVSVFRHIMPETCF